jgi:hypothetical protein
MLGECESLGATDSMIRTVDDCAPLDAARLKQPRRFSQESGSSEGFEPAVVREFLLIVGTTF